VRGFVTVGPSSTGIGLGSCASVTVKIEKGLIINDLLASFCKNHRFRGIGCPILSSIIIDILIFKDIANYRRVTATVVPHGYF